MRKNTNRLQIVRHRCYFLMSLPMWKLHLRAHEGRCPVEDNSHNYKCAIPKTESWKIHNGIAMETVIIMVCLHRCEESEWLRALTHAGVTALNIVALAASKQASPSIPVKYTIFLTGLPWKPGRNRMQLKAWWNGC